MLSTAFIGGMVLVIAAVAAIRSRRDPVALLSIFAILLFLIPARLVLPGLGGIGTPANAVALALLLWWVAWAVMPSLGLPKTPQPVRYALLVYAGCMLLSYALSYLRRLTDLEASGSDRAMIALAAALGVALLAADGIQSRDRLDTLLRRLLLLAAAVSVIGILQAQLRLDVVSYLQPPGLVENRELFAVKERSLFNRPYSTTLHPIEYSVVMAMMLPLALHYAITGAGRAFSLLRWGVVALLAVGAFLSVSRSGILGVLVGISILSLAWSWRRRLNALVLGVLFLGAVRAAVPGLVGTLRNLFLNAEDDPSIQGRLDDMAEVRSLLSDSPWIGFGRGTWNSVENFVLDNEYYRLLLETGVIGVLAIMVLFATAMFAAGRVARVGPNPTERHLGQALLASLFVGAVSLFTFDALAYPMFTGLLFLLIGAAGALWRLNVVPGVSPGRPSAVSLAAR